eukprot:TRINITY_DN5711_c0_g1_i1.p1 TRINITY_DN5711_c0_g1~~TRINITY_DN5711_c0_g1_i1.p1  ORF type:complete len:203 (-),score=15.65 TRINITY_DN5711_c0_g1_i1:4-612(-)
MLQFNSSLRQRVLLHQLTGTTFVATLLIAFAFGTLPALEPFNFALLVGLGFGFVSIVLPAFAAMASIVFFQNFSMHREWVLRCYVSLLVSTLGLRCCSLALPIFQQLAESSSRETWALCFSFSLLLAHTVLEIYLSGNRNRRLRRGWKALVQHQTREKRRNAATPPAGTDPEARVDAALLEEWFVRGSLHAKTRQFEDLKSE